MPLRLGADNDLDVDVEQREEAHQSLGGEPVEFEVHQLGDVRLRNAKNPGGFSLGKTLRCH